MSLIDAFLRQGAQKMLHLALEEEVAHFLARHQMLKDENGCQRVVRNGYKEEGRS